MTADYIISNEIPAITGNYTGDRAVEIMETYLVSELPVVENKNYLGLITMTDIYNLHLFEKQIISAKNSFKRVFIYENVHFFDIFRAFALYNTNILPVLDIKYNFKGVISQKKLIKDLSNILCVKEEGYHLKFTIKNSDFSATQISNIVETNNAKVLSMYVDYINSVEINVYLKISTKDIEAVLQSFERYDYNIFILNNTQSDYTDLYKERIDNLINYLNI